MLDKSMLTTTRDVRPADPAPPPQRPAKDYGEPLNFRVPAEFGERFRMVALQRKMKLQQLLQACFEVYMREEGGRR